MPELVRVRAVITESRPELDPTLEDPNQLKLEGIE
jgi:hypothetical protein